MRNRSIVAVLLLALLSSPATAAVVSYSFSGRAFEDPSLATGTVPPEAAAFFASKNLEGAWFAASFSIEDTVPDSDPEPLAAEYRNSVIDSDLAFGPLQHEATTFCNDLFLDCSVFVDDDLPLFGALSDKYVMRAKNHSVEGVPQVLIPGTDVLVDEFIVNGSFLLDAREFLVGASPSLVTDLAVAQDVESIFTSGEGSITITYFGPGYSFSYRVQELFFLPEPEDGLVWGIMGVVALALRRGSREIPLGTR